MLRYSTPARPTGLSSTISYRPGPKNMKAAALFRLHAPEEAHEGLEAIILDELFVSRIQRSPSSNPSSHASTAIPLSCPPGTQYVLRNGPH